MHFQWLSLLKAFSEEDIRVFDSLLYQIYQKGYYKRFNPRIYKYFDMSINEASWIEALDTLCQHSLATKHFELCHPVEGYTLQTFDLITDVPIGNCIYFGELDEDIYVTANLVFMTYSLSENFKPLIKKEEDKSSKKSKKGVKQLPFSLEEGLDLSSIARNHPKILVDNYVNENREKLLKQLSAVEASDSFTGTTKEKGDLLEDLCEMLFHFPPLLEFKGRNNKNGNTERDLLFRVCKYPETLFGNFSDLLIIECRNKENAVEAKAVRDFHSKMRRIGSKVGVICSKKGITGEAKTGIGAKQEISNIWLSDNDIVIALNLGDLVQTLRKKHNFYRLLQDKYEQVRLM